MAALFMVFLLLSFLGVDILLRKFQPAKQTASLMTKAKISAPLPQGIDKIALPDGLFFHHGHTWAKIDVSGKVFIGIDEFLQKIIGKIDEISIPKVGEIIAQDEKFLSLKQGERKATLLAPFDGVVEEVNSTALKDIKKQRAQNGIDWLVAIKPTNLMENLKDLVIADGAKIWLKREIARFKSFLAEQFLEDKNLGKVMADGGAPVDGIMQQMDDLSWIKFEEEFLHS